MPPVIAALICSIFILIAFVIDFKRRPRVTITHWIPFIWFLILSSRAVTSWLGQQTIGDETVGESEAILIGSEVDRNIFTLLVVFGLVILSRRIDKCKQILKSNAWIIFLFLYCGISILWSDYPFISFKRWFRGVGTLIMVLVVLTEIDPFETIKTMLRRCAFLMIPLSILFIKYYRNLGTYYGEYGGIEYCGVATSKNMLGRLCLILGFYFFWEINERRKSQNEINVNENKIELLINITFLLMIFVLLLKIDSATSLFCLVIGILILSLLKYPLVKSNIKYMTLSIIVVVLILFILDLTFDLRNIIVTSLGRDLTLTGRTELWRSCITFVENPFIGVGYGSFWLGERLNIFWEKYWWHPIQAHNGYIEVYIQLGIIGLILLSGLMLSIYNNIKKTIAVNYKIGSFQLTIFIIFILYNFTENSFNFSSFFWFVFLLIELSNNHREGIVI